MARRRKRRPLSVFVLGAGKVGRALHRKLRAAGVLSTLRAARKGIPRSIRADVVVLAVRDRAIAPLAEQLRGVVAKDAVVVHVAGALGPEPLAALQGVCAGVAQMHPMISFASPTFAPDLSGGNLHVQGDAKAVARARSVGRALGMRARTIPHLDTVAYHAAAGLVANGAAALAAVGAELLVRAGVARAVAPHMLGPLLRSVAANVSALGFPGALTGPVRRGDVDGLRRHLATLAEKLPEAVGLYVSAGLAQLPLARAIGEAPQEALDAIEQALRSHP
jgi:predicted short-subunit dehydrogenase-like oxidoreductase (DUF2520 family)